MCLHGLQQSYSNCGRNVKYWGWSRKECKLSKMNIVIHLRKTPDEVRGLILLTKLNILGMKHLMYVQV